MDKKRKIRKQKAKRAQEAISQLVKDAMAERSRIANESYRRTGDARGTARETGIPLDEVWEHLGFKETGLTSAGRIRLKTVCPI